MRRRCVKMGSRWGGKGMRMISGPRATFARAREPREAREDDFSCSRARKPAHADRASRAPRTSWPHGRALGAQYAGAKRLGQQNPDTPRRLFAGRDGELAFFLGCELETRRGAANMRSLTRQLRCARAAIRPGYDFLFPAPLIGEHRYARAVVHASYGFLAPPPNMRVMIHTSHGARELRLPGPPTRNMRVMIRASYDSREL